MSNLSNILRYFPRTISYELDKSFAENPDLANNLEEIRIRINRPIILKGYKKEKVLKYIVSPEEMISIMQMLCENSIYSYQEQIAQGYITLQGGHRVGICGNVVMQNNNVLNISYISSLNFRIARQVIGASSKILRYLLNIKENTIYTSLIVSPPGCGKTTILRDCIRKISTGMSQINFRGLSCSVIDERGEIAAMYKGMCQNDLGIRTDVLDNISKDLGMKMAIRSMAPEVIAADEIGKKEDVEAILYAVCSGVKGIFTAHGSSIEDIKQNPALLSLLDQKLIQRIIFLSPDKQRGEVEKIYYLNNISGNYEIMS